MTEHPDTYKILERILAKSKREENGCLVWQGSKTRNGYGRVGYGERVKLVHRMVWSLVYGPIPARLSVCHTCDRRPCLEPTHLFLGTKVDNMNDAKDKGRLRK